MIPEVAIWQGVRMFGAICCQPLDKNGRKSERNSGLLSCTPLSLVLVLSVFAISHALADPQIVAGIEIDYPVAFERLKPGAEEARLRTVSDRWRAPASSAEAHKASLPPGMRLTGASGGVEIAKYKLRAEQLLDLDVVARRMMEDVVSAPGAKLVKQFISVAWVTGYEGRRLSLEWQNGSNLYSEELLIHDPGNNNLWYVQAFLSRRFFARLVVERDRSYPKSVLDTVRVIENPKTPL